MKVRYEFDLRKDTCAECTFMIDNRAMGKANYICAIKEFTVGRTINGIYNSERPDWCPLQVIEDQLDVQKSDNK